MVRSGFLTAVSLKPVPISGGRASLGSWGCVELTGAASAIIRMSWSDDISLPEAVAADITGGSVLMNDAFGRLLFLPYAGELVVSYDLQQGELASPLMTLPRNREYGLRMSTLRLLPDIGVIYLTESTLACFREDCTVAWRQDENFLGWTIEGVNLAEVHLLDGNWTGREQRQTRALADGSRRP